MTSELWQHSALELAERIRTKQISVREVVQAHLDRIAAVNPQVNAATVVLAESALAAADAADQAVDRGEALGPLHGVPITVKENIELVGSATTHGVVGFRDLEPSIDSPHVTHLKAAGVIPIARTNMPDFGLRWDTDNGLHGRTYNPWSRAISVGGSSGGEGAALATGMAPLGLGNDYGGSLRIPAQFCGIAALRPSQGRVGRHDTLAVADPLFTGQLFSVQGPMARRVADLRTALHAMSGPTPRDPWWTPAAYLGSDLPKRVAVVTDSLGRGVDEGVAAGIRAAADALANAGYEVTEIAPPGLDITVDVWARLVNQEIRHIVLPQIDPLICADARSFIGFALDLYSDLGLVNYMQDISERHRLGREWSIFQEQYPLILGPVFARQPFAPNADIVSTGALRELFMDLALTVTVNLLGLPSATVPVGVINGLPQGVQLIGPRFGEEICLQAAEAVERALGTITPLDPRDGSKAR